MDQIPTRSKHFSQKQANLNLCHEQHSLIQNPVSLTKSDKGLTGISSVMMISFLERKTQQIIVVEDTIPQARNIMMNIQIESENLQKTAIPFKDSSAIVPSEEVLALGLDLLQNKAFTWTTGRQFNLDLRSSHLLHLQIPLWSLTMPFFQYLTYQSTTTALLSSTMKLFIISVNRNQVLKTQIYQT